jgi:hypothetical protein
MSPYVDLKPEKCMYCSAPARVKLVTIPNGVYMPLCLSCMKELQEREQ